MNAKDDNQIDLIEEDFEMRMDGLGARVII